MTKSTKHILLISPCSVFDKTAADRSLLSFALGPLRLASFLKSRGFDAEFYDSNLRNVTGYGPSLEEKILEKDWDIIGVSILEETLQADLLNIHLAHRLRPKARLVAGGIEAQFNYQTVLDKSPCGIVILGEGEIPMLMLAQGKPLETIPGVVVKNNAKPLDQEQFVEATKSIPWERIPYELYWDYYVKLYGERITPENEQEIHTVRVFSRNRCPIGCKFCSSTFQLTFASGQKVPVIGADEENLLSVIDRVLESHPRVRTIYFTDDDFCINKKAVVRFCERVIERKYPDKLSFMCFARATDLTGEVLDAMKAARFRRLNIGIESFSQTVLDEMGKRCSVEDNHRALQLAKKHGVKPFFNLIATTPESKIEDIEQTIEASIWYASDPFYNAGIVPSITPLKGTAFAEMHCDYISEVRLLGDTGHYLRKDAIILARDPLAREIQLRYRDEADAFVSEQAKANGIFHHISRNLSLIRLRFLQMLVNDAREKHGLPPRIWRERMDNEDIPFPIAAAS